jgi:hypothetical protein
MVRGGNAYPGLQLVAFWVAVGGAVTVTVVVTGGLVAATRRATEVKTASLANIVVVVYERSLVDAVGLL